MTQNSLRNCTDRGLVDHNSLCFLSVTFNYTFNCKFVKKGDNEEVREWPVIENYLW